jgi:hypothetical protein
MSSISRSLRSFLSKRIISRTGFKALPTRVRAEQAPRTEEFHHCENPHIKLHTATNDGAWWCSECKHENELAHYKGDHPFERLKCGKCDHTLCKQCLSTNILKMLPAAYDNPQPVPIFASRLIPYGVICSGPKGCGLTWRACRDKSGAIRLRKKETILSFLHQCACGQELSASTSIRFFIGSNADWRTCPEECYMRIKVERSERTIDQLPQEEMTRMRRNVRPRLTTRQTAQIKPCEPQSYFAHRTTEEFYGGSRTGMRYCYAMVDVPSLSPLRVVNGSVNPIDDYEIELRGT